MICTSILVGLFNKNEEVTKKVFEYLKDYEFKVSPIVYYEFLRGAYNNSDLIPKKPLDMTRAIFKLGVKDITEFDRDVAQSCAYIWSMMWKENNNLVNEKRELDLLIGATASFMECPLWTLNKKHFADIPELVFLEDVPEIEN